MMKLDSPSEIWKVTIHRLRAFNSITGCRTPDIYFPKHPPERDDLLRLREDLDSIVERYDVLEGKCSFRYYITTRYLVESLRDMNFNRKD